MEIRLLGPVQLHAAGEQLELGPPKQRTVLAALLVDAGQPVRTDTLVDRVWDEAPGEARNALYAHIMRIRRALSRASEASGTPASLERRAGGYVIEIDPDRVDWLRFRRLVGEARAAADDRRRAQLLGEALGLWRGTPLVDLSGGWPERIRASWQQQHLDAVVAWAQVELRLGHHDPVIARVRDLAAEYPLVEPLSAVLMQALHAAGRDAEALDRYAAIQHRLADELGTDPGPELQQLHQAILRGDLAPPAPAAAEPAVTPAQLPADVAGFTGRADEIKTLDTVLVEGDQPGAAVMIAAISGTAGVGKTSLAVHWAHQVRDRFPDGQLYVDLRGFGDAGGVRSPAGVVRGFLAALGISPERMPAELDAQVGLYRSLLDGRRMLILLDNASDTEQVRPLLPGTPAAWWW